MNAYSRLIPRLNGKEVEERFAYYLGLVKKGIAGFIIFGGKLEAVRAGLSRLQASSDRPLIIASDLEQGLGQQIEGGTIFPPAMAISSALKKVPREKAASILKELYTAFAKEAAYAGINTILAPVLDINTNPDNPIIATRAFGEDPATVSFFGCEMIRVLQRNGIGACGKHFPGHGDTEVDSHISLPVIRKDLSSLEHNEFVPFKKAISEGVGMIMLGHLSVPAIDPCGKPASLSEKAVTYLRKEMGFKGTVITDAMNMGGVGQYTEHVASLMALDAGVDLILHPSDPDEVAAYLSAKDHRARHVGKFMGDAPGISFPGLTGKSLDARSRTSGMTLKEIDFTRYQELSEQLTRMSITNEGTEECKIEKPFLIILDDEGIEKGNHLIEALSRKYSGIGYCSVSPGQDISSTAIPENHALLVAVFSQIRAWKGDTAEWLGRAIRSLDGKAKAFISFGNPYVLRNVLNAPKIYAYWDSPSAQEAVAEKLFP